MYKRSSYRRWILLVLGGVASTLFVLMSGMAGWSDLNSRHEDIDIRTGRVRRTRYLFHCVVRQTIEESVISRALPSDVLASAQPDWRRVNTFCGWGRVSPHYAFHGALWQLWELSEAQSLVSFSDEAKRIVAVEVLRLWQMEEDDFGANAYPKAVWQTAAEAHFRGASTFGADDLPRMGRQ